MNMKQAEEQGLQFTGATANVWSEKEITELKERAKEIRALGFKAVIVQSLKSEWGGGCKLLYTEVNYSKYKAALEAKKRLGNYEERRSNLLKTYLVKLGELNSDEQSDKDYVEKIEKLLNIKIEL